MGLMCSLDDPAGLWGLPTHTPELFLPIDYSSVAGVFGDTVAEQARSMCPVDTGNLQASISASGGTITVSAEYAQYVEYGTWKSPAQPFLTPAVYAGALTAYTQAVQIYQQSLQVEAMIKNTQGMLGQMMATMTGGAGMMPDGTGMMSSMGSGGGDWVHPETGMSQAHADSILDNYAKEHGIVIPYDDLPQEEKAKIDAKREQQRQINELNRMIGMTGKQSSSIARSLGENVALLVGGSAFNAGFGNLISGMAGLFIGGIITVLAELFFSSMEKQSEDSASIAIPEISVI